MLDHRIPQKIIEVTAIQIINEDRTAVHTPLRDVEREPGKLETWAAWHGTSLKPFESWRSQGLDWVAVGRC
jgi:hypothetical protein